MSPPLEFHEYANLFPMMSEAEIADLSQDIWKHGQEHPIIIHEGKILDGRNRWKACQLGLIEPKLKDYDGADALAFVISLNLKRRHMSESQRAMAAARLATLMHGTNQFSKEDVPIGTSSHRDGVTKEAAAEMLKVGTTSVARAKLVQKTGAPELVAAVESGEITVNAAEQIAKLPAEQQIEVLSEGPAAVKEKAKEVRFFGAEAVAATHIKAADESSTDEPEAKPARITYVQKLGMEIAMKVTSQLDRITNPDKEFEPALRAIIAYCEKRLAQNTKK